MYQSDFSILLSSLSQMKKLKTCKCHMILHFINTGNSTALNF